MKSHRFLKVTAIVVFMVFTAMPTLAQKALQQKQTITRTQRILKQRELTAPKSIKIKLQKFRTEIQQKNLKYTVGYTKALAMPRSALFGDKDDPRITRQYRIKVNRVAMSRLKLDVKARTAYLKKPHMPAFDSSLLVEIIPKGGVLDAFWNLGL